MTSSTKFKIDANTIRKLFDGAGLSGAQDIKPLTAGEFNSAYSVNAGGKGYVIKIAPDSTARVLTYEKDMMRQELASYDLLREKTTIGLPEIYFRDLSKSIIPSEYFIMEKITAPRLDTLKLTGDAAAEALAKEAELLAKMHRIPGGRFGYPQSGLYPTWHEAIRGIVENLVSDSKGFGKKCPFGEELLTYIEKYRDILKKPKPRLINFDLWDLNLFYEKNDDGVRLILIDPERCFWGDPAADLVCLDFMHMELEEKTAAIAEYNKTAEFPFTVNRELKIRYAIMLGYLAVIMYTERYSRYKPLQKGYTRNTVFSAGLAKKSFDFLKGQ
jgi:fructosamine-3-kinase